MTEIIEASEADIPHITHIAESTWPTTYGAFVSPDQIRYMLDTLYSTDGLLQVMRNKSQKFLLLKDNQHHLGFASFGPREDTSIFKLHKLYVLPHHHGKGYGTLLIQEIKRQLAVQKISALDLNVNRNNPAKEFYKKLGFKIIAEEDIPIGQFWMNDYVMRLTIGD